jgi:hypothetical protein
MAACVDLASVTYPQTFRGEAIQPMEGVSLVPALCRSLARTHSADLLGARRKPCDS